MSVHPEIQAMIKERREALLSMNEHKIRAFMRRYGVEPPSTTRAFWVGVHKARATLVDPEFPEEAREASRRWLREKGFRDEIRP